MTLHIARRGGNVPFDGHKFEDWLQHRLDLSRALARGVARQTERDLEALVGQEPVSLDTLKKAGRRYAVRLSFAAGRLQSPLLFGGLPGGLDPGLIAPVAEGLGKLFEKQGFEPDGDGKFIRETFGFPLAADDATAPTVTKIVVTPLKRKPCCKTVMGSTGIQLEITVTVSDTGGIGNNTGVRSIVVTAYGADRVGRPIPGPTVRRKLGTQEAEITEDKDLRTTLLLCVPCTQVKNNTVDLSIRVTDGDDNATICLQQVDVPDSLLAQCCSSLSAPKVAKKLPKAPQKGT